MSLCLALAVMMQQPAGPIDAFRANLASAKAGADFECEIRYNFNAGNLKDVFNFEPGAGPAGEPNYLIKGRWEYDGTCERYVLRVTGGSQFEPNATSGPLPDVEALCDDETVAFHYLGPNEHSFRVHQLANEYPSPMVGPFAPYSGYRFDRRIKVNYAGLTPIRGKGERGGRPVDVEVYRQKMDGLDFREEIDYDPSVGFLPRFYRGIAYGLEDGRSKADVGDYYLIDAKPCRAGGFVPTEWYLITYDIDDFESKYPGYDEGTKLLVPGRSKLIHFKVDRFEDKTDRARLVELAGVRSILAPGGAINSKTDFSPMTMSEIKAILGPKSVKSNRPALPRIDEQELHQFERPKAANWTPYWLAGLALSAVAAFLIRRRSLKLVALVGLIPLVGCGYQPVPRLTAAFAQPRILYDSTDPMLDLELVISNAGNQTLKITKVDAGCSCRQVDPTQLPATVRPGEAAKVSVSTSGKSSYAQDHYAFTFSTDQGQLTATAALLTIPRHRLSPDSVTLSGLDESSRGEASEFDLVHREVFEPGSRDARVDMVIPAGFAKEVRGTHEGRVAGSPDLAFRDTTYHLRLEDRSLGLHRADISVHGDGGRKLVEVPLVWQRLPFLSSVPERIALGLRPSRVFLHCPDDSVELTHVLSSPPGVKATLDSPRSIRVTMSEQAPATLQDFVEVGTNSVDSPTLRIPVVRYAPPAAHP